jgi:hypothetical protein
MARRFARGDRVQRARNFGPPGGGPGSRSTRRARGSGRHRYRQSIVADIGGSYRRRCLLNADYS